MRAASADESTSATHRRVDVPLAERSVATGHGRRLRGADHRKGIGEREQPGSSAVLEQTVTVDECRTPRPSIACGSRPYRRLFAAYRTSAASVEADHEPAAEVTVAALARQFADAVEVAVGGRAAEVVQQPSGNP
jgi:hypothetical protein